ncbi:LOW QUALITY PROTEIN: hypothetical protein HID58_037971, partial [Brassica napus]
EEEVETCSPAPINRNQPVITDVGGYDKLSVYPSSSRVRSLGRRMQWKRNEKKRFSRKVAVITAGFELKHPPYPLDALEPHMSRDTLDFHWGKHHKTYVENLNKQILGTDLDGLSLEEVVLLSYNRGNMLPAFNNAAQAWNHEFFWESIQPGGGGKPSGYLLRLIEREILKGSRQLQPPTLVPVGPGLHTGCCKCHKSTSKGGRQEACNSENSQCSKSALSTRLESAMARAAQREQEGTYTEDEENSEDEEPEVYLDSDVDVSEGCTLQEVSVLEPESAVLEG